MAVPRLEHVEKGADHGGGGGHVVTSPQACGMRAMLAQGASQRGAIYGYLKPRKEEGL
jgi:hypothetical protein